MTASFDLTSRPWLPCERFDGTVVELSTRDALAEAHQLRGLADPSPLVLAVLYRHLLAVLHRVYEGPRTLKAWEAIARAGSFDIARVEAYLTRVRDRMDLFHPIHPFAQTRGLKEQFEATPIDQITAERCGWGGGRQIFQQRAEDFRATMSPAEAARALLAHHGFATGGLVKKPGEPTSATASPLLRGAVVLLRGDSLFRTLLANLLRYDPTAGAPIPGGSADAPSWEQPPPPRQLLQAKEPSVMPAGWLDLLTWTSRRIELVPEGDRVTSFVRAVGKGLAEGAPREPMFAYQIDEKQGVKSIGVNEDRAFWRDAHAFFEATRPEGKFVRPMAIQQAADPAVFEHLGEHVDALELHGISSYQSSLYTMRSERIGAALRHFNDASARATVTHAVARAEDSVKALRSALWTYARHMLSEGSRQPDTKDVSALVTSLCAEPAVWSALGVQFGVLLRGLDGSHDEALAAFSEAIQATVRVAFERATAHADSTARILKARALAERTLFHELNRVFPRTTPTQENPIAPH
jgi:CRISPR system Cascade subunit CasA